MPEKAGSFQTTIRHPKERRALLGMGWPVGHRAERPSEDHPISACQSVLLFIKYFESFAKENMMSGIQSNRFKRRYLRELVFFKNLWDEPLSMEDRSKGFLGWHERGYLPHCDKPGLIQLVTIRLIDSLPHARHGEWKHLLRIEDIRERRMKLEAWLDRGLGRCKLRDACVAGMVEEIMLHHHGSRFELLAWCIMPNHVHALIQIWDWPLARVLQNWKSLSALKANRILGRGGPFWQREYWDTFMRTEKQERSAIHYVETNPVKPRLCRVASEWPFSSARFRDPYNRLVLLS